MSVYNGNDIIILNGSSAIAGTKTTELHTECETIPISSASNADWMHQIAGRKQWSVTVGWLLGASSPMGTQYPGLKDALLVGNTYTLKIQKRGSSVEYVTGDAILRVCDIRATRGNLCTGSFQFVGAGPLT